MLNRECIALCEYLIGQRPNEYVINKYSEAHSLGSVSRETDIKYFDGFLVWLARTSPLLTGLVDAYTSKLHKRSLIRRKLILLIAILECTFPTCNDFDLVSVKSRADFNMKMCSKGVSYAGKVFLSVILLMPVHLLVKLLAGSDRSTNG